MSGDLQITDHRALLGVMLGLPTPAYYQGPPVEGVFREPGRYTIVDHGFVDAEKGARGFLDVSR